MARRRGVERSRIVMEWQAQAEARRARVDLLRALQVRFQVVPADVAAAIAAHNNLDDLTRLFDLALTTPSIERFRTALEQWARVDGARQALLLILQTRFQDPVPADIAAAVSELNDVVELDRWVRAASTAESIDALRSTLGR